MSEINPPRYANPQGFRNNAALLSVMGMTQEQLSSAIASTYATFDVIDFQLITKQLPKISKLVELANLSSMLGNILGAEIANFSGGMYARNKPHSYPDLIPLREGVVELELKIALETNRPKGHLPKAGNYITIRYVLGDEKGGYTRGKETRGDTVWVWEIRLGRLEIEDFAISNTDGDSGKTAVIRTEAFHRMAVVYYDERFLPYAKKSDGTYTGIN